MYADSYEDINLGGIRAGWVGYPGAKETIVQTCLGT